jgi:acyl-CoA synthetase (AMP-forming)/AMP-acid ligase II
MAIIDRGFGKRLTYEEFDSQTNQIAHALFDLGLEKGDTVAVVAPNCAELILSYYGIAKAGMVFVTLNPNQSTKDIQFMITNADSKAVIVDEQFIPKVQEMLHEIKVQHVVGISRTKPVPDGIIDFNAFLAKGSPRMVKVIINDRDPAQILYTGGTTSLPRAAEHHHLGFVLNGANTALDFKMDHHVIWLTALPIYHLAGFNQLMVALFLVGATEVILPGFDPSEILKTIEEEKVTGIFALSPLFRMLIDHPDFDKYDHSSLKMGIYFGAVMPDSLLKECMEKLCPEFALEYGQTEAGDGTTFKPEDQLRKIGSMGNSGTFVELRIMDDDGNLLPSGEPGNIVYRSPFICQKIYGDEKATEEAFKFGWFHSGDIGKMDEDGYFYFLDRKKDMIKTGGENVTSAEVEKAIYRDERVQEVNVIGLPHDFWMEAVTAFVTPKSGTEITEEEIINLCKEYLSGYKVPKKVIFTSDLPRSLTGKVLKTKMRQQYIDLYSNESDSATRSS